MNTELVISLTGSRRSRSQWLRFRLSKLYYEGNVFSDSEIEYLFYIIFDFAEATEDQLDKRLKNRVHTLNFILESRNVLTETATKESMKKLLFYCGSILLTPHEYYGLKNGNRDIDVDVSKLYSVKRKEKIRYPEQRRIGVGYRDKGNAQNIAINGEMNWEYYSTATKDLQENTFSIANLLYRGATLQSEIDNEIEDELHDF